MKPFTTHRGILAVLDRINVDTDQIIPKQFLKRTERAGYGQYLFYDWRFQPDGTPNPDFELNHPRFHGAAILVAGANFGCGSSREHAPWALLDYGFRAIVAPSYSDIFYNNCFQNGMLPVRLPETAVRELMRRAGGTESYSLTIDLESRSMCDDSGLSYSFDVDPFRRDCLLNGWDDIGYTLQHEEQIRAYEALHEAP